MARLIIILFCIVQRLRKWINIVLKLKESLERQLTRPSLVVADLANMEAPGNLHLGFLALHRFLAIYGRLPNIWWVISVIISVVNNVIFTLVPLHIYWLIVKLSLLQLSLSTWHVKLYMSLVNSASSLGVLEDMSLSLWLVLDYGTVCHMTSSRVTHCHISVVDSKHFYLDSHIVLFCFSSLPCGPYGFYLGLVKKFPCNVM